MTVRSRKSRPATSRATSSATSSRALRAGQKHFDYAALENAMESGLALRLARTAALPSPSTEEEPDCGECGLALPTLGLIWSLNRSRALSCLKTCRASRSGKPRSRDAWRALATVWKCETCRLHVLAALIREGECGLLPTVTARDWRSPGRRDHPRLQRSRGLPLPETFGKRITPQLACWMMGFPQEWLRYMPSATP